jgi:hypothetical protein
VKEAAMKTTLSISLLVAAAAWAQRPVAPTNEPTGNPRGDNMADYNILQSFETGYRWRTVGGNGDMYRSTVNYGDGIRLLSSSLSVQSREGHGGLFDQILLNTQGLGNDPYQSATLRIEKNRLYRYDLMWRSTDYFNPALTISNGEHLMDTTRHTQDHDFTVFPQSNLKLFLGYSRNLQNGPALSTIQLFDARGDEYPLFANIRREQNEFRLGGELRVLGFRLNVLRGWQDFKEDTPTNLTSPEQGNNPSDLNALISFRRNEPYHGTSPYWRVALFREGKRYWAMNGRFTYVAGNRAFVFDELSSGANRIGALVNHQVAVFGDARRPAATGNLTFSLFPTSGITITNQTSVNNIRMVGDSFLSQYDLGTAPSPVIPFTYLGIRTVANSTDINVRLSPWFALYAGYHYSDRHIASIEGQENFGSPAPTPPDNTPIEQSNQLKAGTLGFRIKPVKPLTINLDAEIGRANRPIYPISERDYQAFRARVEYRQKSFRASVYARSDYNTNSISLTSFASQSRQYGVDASWVASEWFSIDAGYAKLHLFTLGGIDYFVAPAQEVKGESSLYVSNIHTANLGMRFSILKRVDLYLGYSHVQDVGDGRATPFGPARYTALPAFQAAQTFPLRFESPQARVSLSLSRKVRWNAGYQYYGYNEQFGGIQDYRAHTGYSSISWSF